MEIQGFVKRVFDLKTGVSASGKDWAIKEFLLETYEEHPKTILFQITKLDKINSIVLKEGDNVKVSFDMYAHEWNGRWFNSIIAWKVESQQAAQTAAPTQAAPQSAPTPPPAQPSQPDPFTSNPMKDDGMPF
ncbi:MAG: DUF3127 domain-containing protein [Prevotella sp.]|nr:DUF3127 domain-containing protein [Prevotella sp.]